MAILNNMLPLLFVAFFAISLPQSGNGHFFRPHGEKVVDHLNGIKDTLKTLDHNIKASMEQARSNMANKVHQTQINLGSLLGLHRVPHHENYQHPQPQHVVELVTEKINHLPLLVEEVTEPVINPHENFDVRSNFVLSDEDSMDAEVANTPRTIRFGNFQPSASTPSTYVELNNNQIWL